MPEVFSSPLEDDIRRRANGGEKAVFAQRNPLTEMYPNAEYRNFEQEKTDECLEVSRQPSQPSAHILFCRACAGFVMSLVRRSGSLALRTRWCALTIRLDFHVGAFVAVAVTGDGHTT